jgi:diadenosine tetraphosphate (Ap4A) HIT family hydrolase
MGDFTSETDCPLCRADVSPIIYEGLHWRVVLNRNQDRLGQVFVALRRHVELPTALSADEWLELRELIAATTRRLRDTFAPDHFNYMFLGNEVRHLHLHVFPRYSSPRSAVGVEFIDTGWPDHYTLDPGPTVRADDLEAIAALLRSPTGG